MTKRRTVRKQGSIKELIPGKKYRIKLFVGWVPNPKQAGGKRRRYHSQTIHGTRSQAQEVLDGLVRGKTDETLDLDALDLTVGAYLERWITHVSKRDVRESTSEKQIYMLRTDIIPLLGSLRLSSLSTIHVDKLITYLQEERSLSPRSVRYYVATLSKALNKARTWGLINSNPVKGSSLPKLEPREITVLEPEELIRFLINSLQRRFGAPLLLLLASTGVRPSEAYALRWEDVDLVGGRIHINRTLVRYTGGYQFDRPKTKRSQRLVTLNASMVTLLEALKVAMRPSPSDLVFPNTVGEPLHGSTVYHKIFTPVLQSTPKLCDVKKRTLRMYDLRHSHATHLLLRNTHPKIVSERLGHSTVQITLDTYSHVLPSMQYEAALVVESLYEDEALEDAVTLQEEADKQLAPLKVELRQELSNYCDWLRSQ